MVPTRRSCQSQRFTHDLVVDVGPLLGAEVEPHFVDYFDAQVAEPIVPALGTNIGMNFLADFVGHGRLGQLLGAVAHEATGTVAMESVAAGSWTARGSRLLRN